MALVTRGAGDSASQSQSPEGLSAGWEPVFIIFLGVGMGIENWTSGLWPPRERTYTGEVRGLPLSCLFHPQGPCWPGQPLRVLGVPGA